MKEPPEGPSIALLRRAGPRKWWSSLAHASHVAYRTAAAGAAEKEPTIGRVIRNDRPEQRVLVQPCRGLWEGVRRVVHWLEYLRRWEEIVRYAALFA